MAEEQVSVNQDTNNFNEDEELRMNKMALVSMQERNRRNHIINGEKVKRIAYDENGNIVEVDDI